MKILHQAGHNTTWNTDTLNTDRIGHGIIFSPVHLEYKRMIDISQSIKNDSILDPQFYIPNSQKNKLNSYPFFPEKKLDGFSTSAYHAISSEIAQECIEFQIKQDYFALIIPARYYSEMITDYIDKQARFTVDAFLKIINDLKVRKKVFLTLPLTISMILDTKYRLSLLNWITSYSTIDGIYLLVNFDENRKQILDYNKLLEYLKFIKEIKNTGLELITGYNNTEGLLLTLLDVDYITMGAYENTRKFSVDKFLDAEGDRRGPVARLYFPNLLNWVKFNSIIEIKSQHVEIWRKIYTPTEYMDNVIELNTAPHFTQPALYKHYFKLIEHQYQELFALNNINERKNKILEFISVADDLYQEIFANRILIDQDSNGDHLTLWNRIIQEFDFD